MTEQATIDVSQLPSTAFDTQAPVWWGNTLMLAIETTTVLVMLGSYFYLWRNQSPWPPPQNENVVTMAHPVPDLGAATANVLLLALSVVPMRWCDRHARLGDRRRVLIGLGLLAFVGAASFALRFLEFQGLKFKWDENAYASVIWGILFLHLFYILLGAGEVMMIGFWTLIHGLDEKHAMDVTLTAVYWYWMVGVGIAVYGVVFWWPRIA